MTPEQSKAATLIGLKLASAVSLAFTNGIEMGTPVPVMKANLKAMFNSMVDETAEEMQLS